MDFWSYGNKGMVCRDVLRKLSSFLDGELSLEEKRSIDEHLRTCPSCTKECRKLALVKGLVKKLGEVVPRMRTEQSFSLEWAIRSMHFRKILWTLVALLSLSVAVFLFLGWQRTTLKQHLIDTEYFTALTEDVLTRTRVRVQALELVAGEYK